MSVKERDPLTGHLTTGHEWNGITELNTRVPYAIWWFIGITHIYALITWILVPTWPLGTTYTKGLLGGNDHTRVAEQVVAANEARSVWANKIDTMTSEEIRADPVLMARVNGTAHTLFGDNCAACHGRDAAGGPGFPSLIDTAWLWGGDTDEIMETLRVGINSNHPDTRYAQMPAFGRDGTLTRDQIRTVVGYVQSLSGKHVPAETVSEGATIFAENCVSCHGDEGKGMIELGAPNLTDAFWIYGGDDKSMFETVWGGRQGWMPTWEGRLSETERKILTVYLQQLGAEAQK